MKKKTDLVNLVITFMFSQDEGVDLHHGDTRDPYARVSSIRMHLGTNSRESRNVRVTIHGYKLLDSGRPSVNPIYLSNRTDGLDPEIIEMIVGAMNVELARFDDVEALHAAELTR